MTFSEWVKETTVDLPQIDLLREAAASLGQAWPAQSDRKRDYRTPLSTTQNAPAALIALDEAWSVYLEVTSGKQTWFKSFATTKTAGLIALAAIGVAILVVICEVSQGAKLETLAINGNARGLLTMLFGITTVGTALIIVLAVFMGEGDEDGLAKRFQRGKDILTVLIGVFGAILGFYFGSDKNLIPPNNAGGTEQHSGGEPSKPEGPAKPEIKVPPGGVPATLNPSPIPQNQPSPSPTPPPAAGKKQL